jgi:type IV pilus assembly protein PilY1
MRSPYCFDYLAFFWTLIAGLMHQAVAQALPLHASSLGAPGSETAAGDVVNSKPRLVLDGEDAMYDFLPPLFSAARGNYRQFLQYKKKRRGQGFVGIDGPWIEADIFDSRIATSATVTGWRKLVIGSSAAGAPKLFAIHVPVHSDGDSEAVYSPGAADVLWEIKSSDRHFADLGAVVQKPSVGIMRDGTWVVILGNGSVGKKGPAKLFIIDALTGAFIQSIALPGSANNSVGGVRLVLDRQRQITAAYAGDSQGNLWKFDFSSVRRSDWGLAFGNTALYQAKDAADQVEPITASPRYVAHPQGGNLVLFATGKSIDIALASRHPVQSLYGVWDKVVTGRHSGAVADAISTQSSGAAASGASSKLVQQTLSATSGTPFYRASTNVVNYADKRGWFIRMDKHPSALRLASSPPLVMGREVFQARIPMDDAASALALRPGKSHSFVLNPLTGSAASTAPTWDANGDGVLRSATGQTSTAAAKMGLRRSWRQIMNRPAPGTITHAGGS